jgi:hypothetical protein
MNFILFIFYLLREVEKEYFKNINPIKSDIYFVLVLMGKDIYYENYDIVVLILCLLYLIILNIIILLFNL